jgi:AcrR family transcriptional regulator
MIVLFCSACYPIAMTASKVKAIVPKRTNDPKGVRNRLIDAAAQMFHKNGFTATSMHDVRATAEVTGGALYHHFPTKKELVLAVIAERVRSEIAATWIDTVRTADDAATGILTVFDDVIANLESTGSVTGCPLNNLAVELSLADPDIRQALAHEFEAWRLAVEERLSEDQIAGSANYIGHSETIEFSYVVVAMFSGAMAIAKAEQRTLALQACATQLRRMMGLGKI